MEISWEICEIKVNKYVKLRPEKWPSILCKRHNAAFCHIIYSVCSYCIHCVSSIEGVENAGREPLSILFSMLITLFWTLSCSSVATSRFRSIACNGDMDHLCAGSPNSATGMASVSSSNASRNACAEGHLLEKSMRVARHAKRAWQTLRRSYRESCWCVGVAQRQNATVTPAWN